MGSVPAHRQYRDLRALALQGDEEAVHRLRKLARTAETRAWVGELPKRDRRAWQQVRRAASVLRDHDVTGPLIRQALHALDIPASEVTAISEAWAARRAALLRELTLPERMPKSPDTTGRKRWERFLAAEAARVQATVPPHDGRVRAEEWHDWRKALKRYRVVLELRGQSPEKLVTLLRVLGEAQDAQTLLELAGREPLLTAYRSGLVRAAQVQRRLARQEACRQWNFLESSLKPVNESSLAARTCPPSGRQNPVIPVARHTRVFVGHQSRTGAVEVEASWPRSGHLTAAFCSFSG